MTRNDAPVSLSKGLDPIFCVCVVILAAWGLIMVGSASISVADTRFGNPMHYFVRQSAFLLLAIGLAVVILQIPTNWYHRWRWPILGTGFALLLAVAVIGVEVNHAKRWLHFGIVRVQASEPARLAFFVWLAGYIVAQQKDLLSSGWALVRPTLFLGAMSMFLMFEPDMGATVLLATVSLIMLFLGGGRWKVIVGALLPVLAAGAALLIWASDYRRRRVLSYMDPFADAQGSGYQLSNAIIAIGRGEWTGVGLGNSLQKLGYLPEMHTDFIFSILAEELGLVGVVALVALFMTLAWRGFVMARMAELLERRFDAYLCYGLVTWICLQAIINFGVNLGALPTKGLTLPLFSYGGSSLITVFVVLAIILRIDAQNRYALSLMPRHLREGLQVGATPFALNWVLGLLRKPRENAEGAT